MSSSLFTITGTVNKNRGRGKQLGYPTANIDIAFELPEGIYVGYTHLNERKLPSLIFIGPAITFGETDRKAEIYILDFDEDIYHMHIQVAVEKKLRDNVKFDSVEALIVQMKKDEEEARVYFKNV